MPGQLKLLRAHGQSPWIDFITRKFVHGGDLALMVDRGIAGITSNPTIFQKAVSQGNDYDAQLRELAAASATPEEAFEAIACDDIQAACDVLLRAPTQTPAASDGLVSLEVSPHLANDSQGTFEQAHSLHARVSRSNLLVKIPGTQEGLQAIESTVATGISVNVTLLFSLERHRQAARAYIHGLRRFAAAGGDLSTVNSVASFFISRVDAEADRRLEQLGGHEELKGTLAIANAKLAYKSYQTIFSGPDWEELQALGATPQRCLWASTSTKDASMSDVRYVDELIGPETVNTMPPATIAAFEDHGTVADTLVTGVDEAHRTLDAFDRAGIDYDEIVETLESEGVKKFAASYDELIEGIEAKLKSIVAT